MQNKKSQFFAYFYQLSSFSLFSPHFTVCKDVKRENPLI